MKYLVLQNEQSIKFVVFNGPGYHLTIAGERSDVPYFVRQHINSQSGTISINEVSNYSGGSLFILTNSGCNISVEGKHAPQGVSVMEEGKRFMVAKLTMFLIDEDERSDIEADFNNQNHFDFEEDLEDHWQPPSPVIEEDPGFCENNIADENWDEDSDEEDDDEASL